MDSSSLSSWVLKYSALRGTTQLTLSSSPYTKPTTQLTLSSSFHYSAYYDEYSPLSQPGPTGSAACLRGSSGLVQRATRARPGGESAPERIVYATGMRGTARARSEIRVRILSEEEPQEHHES